MSGPAGGRRELGQRLAAARKAAGLTQVQLAAVAGYSRRQAAGLPEAVPDTRLEMFRRARQRIMSGMAGVVSGGLLRAARGRNGARSG